jgi:multiple antibiotic resistance protein
MEGLFADAVKTTLFALAALFPIVNPLGNAPIFLTMTRGASPETRRLLARRIAINGFILLVVSMLVGTYILAFFGISLPVVQVGGGLVLASAGWSLLTRPDEAESPEANVRRTDADLLNQSFYPLTLPLTVGPGSVSVALTLGANVPRAVVPDPEVVVAALIAPAVVGLAVYLSYRWAEGLERALGRSAMGVFVRLSSFILLCIGVQIVWNGVSALWLSLPRR